MYKKCWSGCPGIGSHSGFNCYVSTKEIGDGGSRASVKQRLTRSIITLRCNWKQVDVVVSPVADCN